MGKLFALGIQFAVAIILFTYAGLWADGRLDSSPWGVLLGAFVGLGVGVYALYRAAAGSQADDKPPAGSGGPP